MAATTEAMTIDPSIRAFKSPTISSRVKTTAAIGVLNAAAIPDAEPMASNDLILFLLIWKNWPTLLPKAEQTATVGPSLPNENPADKERMVTKNFAMVSRNGSLPLKTASAIRTPGIPDPEVPGNFRVVIQPEINVAIIPKSNAFRVKVEFVPK